MEPNFQNRKTYSNFKDMQPLRRSDGIWEFDESFRNDEVDVFRMFIIWKVGSYWRELTQQRPTPEFLPPASRNARSLIDYTLINAGGRDAHQFQPNLPAPPATKPKDQPRAKKLPADSRPKSDRQKKVKNPQNVEPPTATQEDSGQRWGMRTVGFNSIGLVRAESNN